MEGEGKVVSKAVMQVGATEEGREGEVRGVWEAVMQVGKREALWVVRLMEMAEEGRAGCGVEILKVVMAKVAWVVGKLV